MARRQVDQLDTPGAEKGIVADEEGVGPLAHKSCEGRFDLVAGVGVEDLDLQPHGAGSRFHVSHVISAFVALAGLTSTATRVAAGTSSRRSSSRFAVNSVTKKLIPVKLPPGRARLATRPSLTGSSGTAKTMGIAVVAALAANAVAVADRGDHGNLAANQIGRQSGQSIKSAFRPSGIRSPRSGLQHSRLQSPGEMRSGGARLAQTTVGLGIPITGIAAAAPAPRPATPARRREA